MPRPIGARIRQTCSLLEQLGKSPMQNVWAQMPPEVEKTNAWKYMNRAASFGLVTVDRTGKPWLYEVNPDWREKVDKPKKEAVIVSKVPQKAAIPVNSVWQLGAA